MLAAGRYGQDVGLSPDKLHREHGPAIRCAIFATGKTSPLDSDLSVSLHHRRGVHHSSHGGSDVETMPEAVPRVDQPADRLPSCVTRSGSPVDAWWLGADKEVVESSDPEQPFPQCSGGRSSSATSEEIGVRAMDAVDRSSEGGNAKLGAASEPNEILGHTRRD